MQKNGTILNGTLLIFSKLNSLLEKATNEVKNVLAKVTNRFVQNEQIINSKTENNYTNNPPLYLPLKREKMKLISNNF